MLVCAQLFPRVIGKCRICLSVLSQAISGDATTRARAGSRTWRSARWSGVSLTGRSCAARAPTRAGPCCSSWRSYRYAREGGFSYRIFLCDSLVNILISGCSLFSLLSWNRSLHGSSLDVFYDTDAADEILIKIRGWFLAIFESIYVMKNLFDFPSFLGYKVCNDSRPLKRCRVGHFNLIHVLILLTFEFVVWEIEKNEKLICCTSVTCVPVGLTNLFSSKYWPH